MQILWGVLVAALALLCWGGQAIVAFAPARSVRLGLTEAEDDVEPAFWADARGEAPWDALTLWTLLVAGVLLALDHPAWAYFGLVGGGMYVYFAGRGLFTRTAMRRRGLRIGVSQQLRMIFAALLIWGVLGLVMIVASVASLHAS